VTTMRKHILVLAVVLAFLSPAALRSEQPQKASHPTQEDRLKKLEDRADAAEKAAASEAMEKDYITRTQKQYESYYQKVLNTQMWTMAIMGLILTGVFVLVARFSLKLIDEQTKTATAGATVQMRNEYARALAKDVQKLWDSNAADVKKLKETQTAQFAELQQNLKDRSDFQMHFVQALSEDLSQRQGDSLPTFRNALRTYKSGKPRNLIEAKLGATTARSIFESLRSQHGENHLDKAREELADSLYDGLEEELALAALQSPWLTPLINERTPALPEPPPAPEPAAAAHPTPTIPQTNHAEPDHLSLDEESDSCRLITT
jgi:multidrug efflux pump subunit AcrB